MDKRLVFHFYLKREWFPFEGKVFEDDDNKKVAQLYNFHFYCLKKLSDVFDTMQFVLCVDDENDIELIRAAEERLLKMHYTGKIIFDIVKNSDLRESETFKRCVVDKLQDNELVFFAHSKGLTNLNKCNIANIYKWVGGMYYFNLGIKYFEEAISDLLNTKAISYGTFPQLDENNLTNKYHWFYIGTFFWINTGKLYNYIKQNNIELPTLSDRFYSEEFLGNIYDLGPYSQYNNGMYLIGACDFYKYTDDFIKMLYSKEEIEDFEYFLAKALEDIDK